MKSCSVISARSLDEICDISGYWSAQSGGFSSLLWAAVLEQLEKLADTVLMEMQRDTFGGISGLLATVNYHLLWDAVAAGLCNCTSPNENFHLCLRIGRWNYKNCQDRERRRRADRGRDAEMELMQERCFTLMLMFQFVLTFLLTKHFW